MAQLISDGMNIRRDGAELEGDMRVGQVQENEVEAKQGEEQRLVGEEERGEGEVVEERGARVAEIRLG